MDNAEMHLGLGKGGFNGFEKSLDPVQTDKKALKAGPIRDLPLVLSWLFIKILCRIPRALPRGDSLPGFFGGGSFPCNATIN